MNKTKRTKAPAAPRVAFAGKTGTGKSTLVAALTGAKVPTSHTRAKTVKPRAYRWNSEIGHRGTAVDLPGFGESISRADAILEANILELARASQVVWTLKADDRVYADIEHWWVQLSAAGVLAPSRLIIAITRSDQIEPSATFDAVSSLLSSEQQLGLRRKQDNFVHIMRPIIDLSSVPFVQVSARYGIGFSELEALTLRPRGTP